MSRKITFEDKVTKNVSTEEDKYKITAKDVNEIKSAVNENAEKIDKINNVRIIEMDSQFIISQTGVAEVLPFNTAYVFKENTPCIENIGNGQMKVVNGSHLVKISGQLCFTAGELNGKEISVRVNEGAYCTAQRFTKYNYDFLDIPEKVMAVNEGYIITIAMTGNQGDTIEAWGDKTYLNIEVLS